jgi:hypothetical protein
VEKMAMQMSFKKLKLRIVPLIKEGILAETEKFQKRERERRRRIQGLETEVLEALYIKGKSGKGKVSRTQKLTLWQ